MKNPQFYKRNTYKVNASILILAIIISIILGSCSSNVNSENGNGEGTYLQKAAEVERILPENVAGGNILHAWNMTFVDIKDRLPDVAAAGFNTIQTSPVGASLFQFPDESRVGTWWMLYQPIAFSIGNMLGTEEEFRQLTTAAADLGISIIVDAVPNHMTAFWDQIDPSLQVPDLFHAVPGDGTRWDMNINNFNDRAVSTHARLSGLIDINTGNPQMQQLYMNFLAEIIDAGASGFRFDAMKHIELPTPFDEEEIASDFWPVIQKFVEDRITESGRTPFLYGEILDNFHEMYLRALPGMSVTADRYGMQVRRNLVNGSLRGWDTRNFSIIDYDGAVPQRFVTWIESHDTYGNDGESRGLTEEQIRLGWAFLASREGTSPLFLVRPGPDFENNGQMFSPLDDGSYINNWGHSDFFQDEVIVELNWFANFFYGQGEKTSTPASGIALIERGNEDATTGIVIINATQDAQEVNFSVSMIDGVYLNHINGEEYTVSQGVISGPVIPEQSVAVIYLQP